MVKQPGPFGPQRLFGLTDGRGDLLSHEITVPRGYRPPACHRTDPNSTNART